MPQDSSQPARKPVARRIRSAVKNALWAASRHIALHGLCSWQHEQHWVLFERRELPLPGLHPALAGLTIAHLSDIHCSPIMPPRSLRRYVERVNAAEPDFVVVTGDFITARQKNYARSAAAVTGALAPRIATLAVLGNHDYGVWTPRLHSPSPGLARFLADEFRRHGVVLLRNDSYLIRRGGGWLNFVGVGDLWSRDYQPMQAFEHVPPRRPVIALCHNPDAAQELADLGASYVLCGHTHGKHVTETPLNDLLCPVAHRHFVAGHYLLGRGRGVYVNRGLGPARRLYANSRPEITLFTLRSAPPAPPAAAEPKRQRAASTS